MKEAANMPEGARIVPRLQKHEEAISLWRYEGPCAPASRRGRTPSRG